MTNLLRTLALLLLVVPLAAADCGHEKAASEPAAAQSDGEAITSEDFESGAPSATVPGQADADRDADEAEDSDAEP